MGLKVSEAPITLTERFVESNSFCSFQNNFFNNAWLLFMNNLGYISNSQSMVY
jgi:hypothetical protein